MDFTTDKLRSMVRKWQTLIEAHTDVKTTDGYLLRMFCIAFTKKRQEQLKKTCYARSSQVGLHCPSQTACLQPWAHQQAKVCSCTVLDRLPGVKPAVDHL